MFLLKKKNTIDEKEKIGNSILNWSMGNESFLNVISIPYNSSDIFIKTILEFVKRGKKVIYITNENSESISLLESIKKQTHFREYAYIRTPKSNINSKLVISNLKNALMIDDKFDLVIYDDIKSFPMYDRNEILSLASKISKEDTKFIAYSIESILQGAREFALPVKDNRIPMVEPRIITTRIDINKDIPFVAYEYLKWFISCDKKVVICVPDDGKLEKVNSYISSYCKSINRNVMCLVKHTNNKKVISNFGKIKQAVLITNDFQQLFYEAYDANIMVYFADNPEFNYKQLTYFCGSVGHGDKDLKGEVIFLANEETRDMEKAKSITRNFNKEAWEMGLLRI